MIQLIPRFLKLCLFIGIYSFSNSFAQTTIWSDNFDAPSGGSTNNNAGAGWTLNTEGNTGNRWFINTPSGIGCTSSGNVLHISCTGFLCGILGGPNEPIYAAAGSNLKTASSPNISTIGQSNLTLTFDFVCVGFAGSDFGTLALSSDGGTNWTDLPGTYNGVSTCSTKTITIPAQYENIANFKMRFKWQESNANNGVDPPFSIDNIRITTPTGACTPPTVNAGTAATICVGQTANLGGAPTATGGSGNGTYTYAWSPAAGLSNATAANPTANPTTTTTYNLTVSQGGAVCTGTGSVTVTVNPSITPTFATINPICTGATAPTLPTTSTNGISGTWNPAVVSNTATGSYTFTPTSNPCATPVTITVTVNSTIIPTFATINPICTGATAPTLPTTSTNGISGTWNPAVVSNTATGSYTFTPTSNPCATPVTITVTINEPEILSITPSGNLTACEGEETDFTATDGFINYNWNSPDGVLNGASISSTSQGNFSVTATDANGCLASSPTTVVSFFETDSILVVADGALTICQGENVILSAQDGLNNYTWSNGFAGQSLTITQSGNYSVTADDENGCSVSSSIFDITAIPAFNISISPQGPIESCEGEVVQLVAEPGFTNYSWSNSITNDTLIVVETGGYSVSAEDENGCIGVSGIVNVEINASPEASFSYAQTFTTEYEVQFTNSSTGENNYLWNFGGNNTSTEESPLFTFAFDNNWPVQLIASNDCGKDTFQMNVTVIKTGIENLAGINSLQIGPNPSDEELHIKGKILNNQERFTIKLIDITGKLLFENKITVNGLLDYAINTKEFSSGIYYVLIEADNGFISRKWIKQ